MPEHPLHAPVLDWYAAHARDLPWRRHGTSAWGVLVSEVMLQQTPVARVEPVWAAWLERWPTPRALAAGAPGDAVRAWDRLGYPRRALRLHAAAVVIAVDHGGEVPADVASLRALPGVGEYTAAAVASFAFGARAAVVDTNVRRVQARAVSGLALPAPALTAAEGALALSLVPGDGADGAAGAGGAPGPVRTRDPVGTAPRWAVAVMELGALVCTARAPRCGACPVLHLCAWQRAGAPPDALAGSPARRGQSWAGTDRQVRGRLLALLREAPGPVQGAELEAAWGEPVQRARCLASLLADGLVEAVPTGYALPGL